MVAFVLNVSFRTTPKYWVTLTPYHTCPKITAILFYCLFLCLKAAAWMANSVDSDQMLHSSMSTLGL